MAANRKNQSAAVRFAPAIYAFLVCLFFGGAGVGFVWQKKQIDSLGRQIKEAEIRLADLRRLNKQRSNTLAFMRSPQMLDARIRELNLGLVQPQAGQIWRLMEPPVETRTPEAPAGRMAAGPASGPLVR